MVQSVRYNSTLLGAAKEKLDQQTIYRQQERTRVESDLEKVKFEREQISQLAQTMTEVRERLLSQLRQLFEDNIHLAKSLEAFHQAVISQTDREVESATSAP